MRLLYVIARINLVFAPRFDPKEFITHREPTTYARE